MKARVPKEYTTKGKSNNFQEIAKKAQQMQKNMTNANEELEKKKYTSSSGGGKVEVTVTGKMEVDSVNINPEVVDPEDTEMLEDLVKAATNEALRAASRDKEKVIEEVSGAMHIPGLSGLF